MPSRFKLYNEFRRGDGKDKQKEGKLIEDQLKRLDEIWPGPGGEAPTAYAW